MQEDNLYPRQSAEWLTEAQTGSRTDPTERAVNEKRDIIEEVVNWFTDEVQALDSVEALTPNPETNPDDFMRAWMVNRALKEKLLGKKLELEALLEDYPKR